MGTWGSGSFENDDAGDFAIDFESEGLGALSAAFDFSDEEPLDASKAQRAVAAAEILAMILNGETEAEGLSPELYDAIERHASDIRPRGKALARQALAVLEHVLDEQSELRMLWMESGDADDWIAAIADLGERLVV